MQTVLITGGLSFIGHHITEFFIAKQYHVIIHYHSKKPVLKLNGSYELIQADFSNSESLNNFINQVFKKDIHILINNASIFQKSPISTWDLASLQNIFNINLFAPMLLSQTFIKQNIFSKNNEGLIINIIDIYADRLVKNIIPYSLSKNALKTFTLNLAKISGEYIRVNGISPGFVKEVDNKLLQKNIIKRNVKIEEIIQTIEFLLNNTAITGEVINVDCGLSLY